jgi:hypothetical protein
VTAHMTCQHLRQLEDAIIASGIGETYRGQAWSTNCRQWVYFDCHLDVDAVREQFALPSCVVDHVNDDPRSGRESGLVCEQCHDAVIGLHRSDAVGKRSFPNDCRREND